MYLADSRSTDGARPSGRGTRPGRTAAAVPTTVIALGAVSLITDVSSEMVTAVLPLYFVVLAADRTGKGLRTAPRDAMISFATEPATRGRAFGVHRAMDTTGALLGPIVAFLVLRTAADGYDAVFSLSGCIAALGVVVLLLFVPGRTAPPEAPPANGERRAPVRSLLRRSAVRRLTLCAVLLGLTSVSDSFLYLSLQRRLGLSDSWFPLLPLGTAAGFLLLAVPFGLVADRIGRRRLFLIGHLGLLGAYLLLLTPGKGSVLLPCLVLALQGAFYAATDGVLAAATADAVPESERGTGLAVVQTGQATARLVCSIGFGAAWTMWGDRSALAVATAGLVAAVAVSAVLLRPAVSTSTPEGVR
ncbi:MFS transporter [Streptomyces sp. BPTC-684]|uniref:MFS transporter n=1 Tax=Streptomyces sp. BPTC-684 TaxID=3043734 RepID=UPI0024B18821|nr:MFS transporter [Streptomyces sp. BPTC-684]WHM40541.1 MFS transporter [Streptomyces sp. BPTC-684]